MPPEKKICSACHGTGQWTSFKGVSRFFFSVEECPECAGLGFILAPEEEPAPIKRRAPATQVAKPQRSRHKK